MFFLDAVFIYFSCEQGEHNTKYNDYNDSRQKMTKYELEVERLRQENDR